MQIEKVESKSQPGTFRTVRCSEGLDGITYECSCPANVWYRASNGRRGKADCSHITEIKRRFDKKQKEGV